VPQAYLYENKIISRVKFIIVLARISSRVNYNQIFKEITLIAEHKLRILTLMKSELAQPLPRC
jgi:hypothetical protein